MPLQTRGVLVDEDFLAIAYDDVPVCATIATLGIAFFSVDYSHSSSTYALLPLVALSLALIFYWFNVWQIVRAPQGPLWAHTWVNLERLQEMFLAHASLIEALRQAQAADAMKHRDIERFHALLKDGWNQDKKTGVYSYPQVKL